MQTIWIALSLCINNIIAQKSLLCTPNADCIINCTSIDPINGCYDTLINASDSLSLSLICSSTSHSLGGCQSAQIYCPSNGICDISCLQQKSCYSSTIYSSKHTNITCYKETDTCFDTILIANNSQNVDVTCYGSCYSFNIYAFNVSNTTRLSCIGDYSCDSINLFVNYSNNVIINAIGDSALQFSFIYGYQAEQMKMLCATHNGEYSSCSHTNVYLPSFTSINNPRYHLNLEGKHQNLDLSLFTINGWLDVDISYNGCNECQSISKCLLGDITLFCGDNYSEMVLLSGTSCGNNTVCNCNHGFINMNTNWSNDYQQCAMFDSFYQCKNGQDCIIDCNYDVDISCYNAVIDAKNASSLQLICNSDSSLSSIGACQSSHIYCPTGKDSECHIACLKSNACQNIEITANSGSSLLNVTCTDFYSCSDIDIFGEYADNIHVNCINSVYACISMDIYANFANNIMLICDGTAIESYPRNYAQNYMAICKWIELYAYYINNEIKLLCYGNNSCYNPFIMSNHSNSVRVVVESFGDHALFGGILQFQTVESLSISCLSSINSSCSATDIYLPEFSTILQCEGLGCNQLNLYALNGMRDIINTTFNGCGVCDTLNDCINSWNLYCGQIYQTSINFNGKSCHDEPDCRCSNLTNLLEKQWESNQDKTQCTIFEPDELCINDEDCIIDCMNINCQEHIIYGIHAKSLTVECGDDNCKSVEIYCPDLFEGECVINCTDYHSCYDIKVYGNTDSIINVHCIAEYSCGSMDLYVDDAALVNVSCVIPDACHSMIIEATWAKDVNIECMNKDGITQYHSPCPYIRIYADYVRNQMMLLCDGIYACVQAKIYSDNAQNVIINAINDHSFHESYIYASNASLLTLLCVYGCYDIHAYLPADSNNIDLSCIGYGCQYMNIYVTEQINADKLNMRFTGCGICQSIDECISKWILRCRHSYNTETFLYGTTCASTLCGCQELLPIIQTAWKNDIKQSNELCLNDNNLYENYQCDKDKDCDIECDDNYCYNQTIINAELSTSIDLKCNRDNGCNSSVIYCPTTQNSVCRVSCNGLKSCENVQIISNQYTQLKVECNEQESCNKTYIWAANTEKVDIECKNSMTCRYSTIYVPDVEKLNMICKGESCTKLNIQSQNARNITLKCLNLDNETDSGQYSCKQLELDGSNAENVYIYGDNSLYMLYKAYIWATNTSNLVIECRGEHQSYGCNHIYVHFPSNSSELLCYGYGCQEIYFNLDNKGTPQIKVYLDDCNVCNSLDNCIDSWHLSCKYPKHQSTIYDGDSCTSDKCQCDQLFNPSTIKYATNSSLQEICFTPTTAPTKQPTKGEITTAPTSRSMDTNSPTSSSKVTSGIETTMSYYDYLLTNVTDDIYENNNNTNNKQMGFGIVIIMVIATVLMFCIAFYGIRRIKNRRKKADMIAPPDPAAKIEINDEGVEGISPMISMQQIKRKRKKRKRIPYIQLHDEQINGNNNNGDNDNNINNDLGEGFVE